MFELPKSVRLLPYPYTFDLVLLCNMQLTLVYFILASVLAAIPAFRIQKLAAQAHTAARSPLALSTRWDPPTAEIESDDGNGIAYTVELPKAAGISWSSDLSFRWIYVQDVDPTSEAAFTGMIKKGNATWLCRTD